MIRTITIIVGSILTVAAIAMGANTMVDAMAMRTVKNQAVFDDPALRRLQFDSEAGQVNVRPSPGNAVTVERDARWGLADPSFTERVVGDTLVVETDCREWPGLGCDIDYDIRIPASFSVLVEGADSIDVRGIRGDLDLSSNTGTITVVDAEGRLDLSTDTGSVEASGLRSSTVRADTDTGGVELAFVAPPAGVEATTDTGSVDVVIPPDSGPYRVSADSDVGSTSTEIRTDPAASRSIVAQTDVGDVRVSYDPR